MCQDHAIQFPVINMNRAVQFEKGYNRAFTHMG